MLVPGSNLLGIALRAITPTGGAQVKRFVGESTNDFGSVIKTYTDPEPMLGCSVQPVTSATIQQLGLSLTKAYVNIWTQSNVQAGYDGKEGDIILWDGSEWEVLSPTNWQVQDGWKQIIAVRQ
jgi:hypothetical protein